MTDEMRPGDWTDIFNVLNKSKQPMSMVNPQHPWEDSYLITEGHNGTIVFCFNGYDIKSIDVSTKSLRELTDELNRKCGNLWRIQHEEDR